MKKSPEESSLSDVQGREDNRRLAIDKVGVKNIRYPIVVKDRSVGSQNTVASVNMYVNLPHHFKGTHMSRFLEVLSEYDRAIAIDSLPELLGKICERLDAEDAHIELEFPYFINKIAPISKASSLMDYQVSFVSSLGPNGYKCTVRVVVPVTTLCPCSKEISDAGAHNQRSYVTLNVRIG